MRRLLRLTALSTGLAAIASAQAPVQTLVDPVAPADPSLGTAAASSGKTLLLGASHDGKVANAAGAAYTFERTGSAQWEAGRELLASDGADGDRFGFSLDVQGDLAVVSAPYKRVATKAWAGAAYVFERDDAGTPEDPLDDDWSEVSVLTASDTSASAYMGYSTALDGDRVLLGAPGKSYFINKAGAVYLFERNGASWTETQVRPSDPWAGGRFGESVAISGDTFVVGAPGANTAGADAGTAYVYEIEPDGTVTETVLVASDATPHADFGTTVDIDGDTILVGAPDVDAVYVFERGPSGWVETQILSHDLDGFFGAEVALDGDVAAIGAVGFLFLPGHVRLYARQGGTWSETDELAINVQPGEQVALDGGFLAVHQGSGTSIYEPTIPDSLTASPASISIATGGVQALGLSAGSSLAGKIYLVLGSASGTSGGLFVNGATLPLTPDAYTLATLTQANGSIFQSTTGLLDGDGKAGAAIAVPAGLSPGLAGTTLHHAYAVLDIVAGDVPGLFASNAVALQLVP